MQKVFIIAEAGDNHNGDITLAYRMIDAAVDAGADCVKFQTFVTEDIVVKNAKKAPYQIQTTGADESQYDMIKKLELSFTQFRLLQNYCKQKGILFLSTPFDCKSIDFLQEIDVPLWKIPSGEITNYPYLVKIARTHKDILLSTGMCTLNEVEATINLLKAEGAGNITLLHCTTEYPTPYKDVNLRAMVTMQKTFGLPVGYSDHTLGIEVSIAAVALGAAVIEKHFTLDQNMKGPDHKASLEPDMLRRMIEAIRNTEFSIGDGIKRPNCGELDNMAVARKSIVAKRRIEKGEVFSEENITAKRPGTGMNPMCWPMLTGTSSPRIYEKDEMIDYLQE